MIRLRIFVITALILLCWILLSQTEGAVQDKVLITFRGYEYESRLSFAATALITLMIMVLGGWQAIKYAWESPSRVINKLRMYRKEQGYRALSEAIIAVCAGDIVQASQNKRVASKYIGDKEPALIGFLNIRLLLLAQKHEEAAQKFEEMTLNPETSLFGLKGLYHHNQRLRKWAEARIYALRAEKLHPGIPWVQEAVLEEKIMKGDWDDALGIIEIQRAESEPQNSFAINRKEAGILIEKANSLSVTCPEKARSTVLQSIRLCPGFTPAALTAARILASHNEIRKARKILETAWEINPHPEIADCYLNMEPDTTPHERFEKAQRLYIKNPDHIESFLVVARAALEAGDLARARHEAEKALYIEPRQGVWKLLVAMEEANLNKDEAYIKKCLWQALNAPKDPAWIAEEHVFENWHLQSPITGKIDIFEWRSPNLKNDTMRSPLLPWFPKA